MKIDPGTDKPKNADGRRRDRRGEELPGKSKRLEFDELMGDDGWKLEEASKPDSKIVISEPQPKKAPGKKGRPAKRQTGAGNPGLPSYLPPEQALNQAPRPVQPTTEIKAPSARVKAPARTSKQMGATTAISSEAIQSGSKPVPQKEPAVKIEPKSAKGSKKRIAWVDIAKAFAIVFIIIGHFSAFMAVVEEASYIPWAHKLLEFCYSFHVPLFFLLSGYCMKDSIPSPGKYGSFAAKTWLPYIVAGIFTVIVGVNLSQTNDWDKWWAALLYGTGGYGVGDALKAEPFGEVAIGVIWFLPALFFAKTIVMFTSKIPPLIRLPLMAACFAGGSLWACSYYLPLSFQEGIACAWYVYLGCVLKKYDAVIRMTSPSASYGKTEKIGWMLLHIYVAVFGIWYMVMLTTEQMAEPNYCLSWYHQIPIDILGTSCAAIVVIFACVYLDRFLKAMGRSGRMVSAPIELLGRNTLPVFAYHGVSLAYADNLIKQLGDICEAGADPVSVLWAAIAANLALACLASGISYLIPGLHYVFFPGKKHPLSRKKTEKEPSSG